MAPPLRPLRPSAAPAADAPIKHVIAEYRHRAQTVTCVCGWHGSTVEPASGRSDWGEHVAINRPRRP
jgi:hypothetical protein